MSSLYPFQYGLRHLLIAVTLCNVAFFLLVILTHQGGTREELPPEEQAVLKSIEVDGNVTFAEIPCSFRMPVDLSIRWSYEGKYRVVGMEILGGRELGWIAQCKRLPKLRSVRLRGTSPYAAQSVQRELQGTPVRVEYWDGKWVPAPRDL